MVRTAIEEELDDPDASWKILYHKVSRKSLYLDNAGLYLVCILSLDVDVGTLIVPSSKRHFVSCVRGMLGEDENGLSPELFDFRMEIHAKLFLGDLAV